MDIDKIDANFGNKVKIVKAIEQLLASSPLDKVTIAELCAQAGISRPTFYRCFKDKYDATVWYMRLLISDSCGRIGKDVGWRTGYLVFLRALEANRTFHERICASDDYNSVTKTCKRDVACDLVRRYTLLRGEEPDGRILFQIKTFAQVGIDIINEWVRTGCDPGSDEFVDWLLMFVPRELFEALDLEDEGFENNMFVIAF